MIHHVDLVADPASSSAAAASPASVSFT